MADEIRPTTGPRRVALVTGLLLLVGFVVPWGLLELAQPPTSPAGAKTTAGSLAVPGPPPTEAASPTTTTTVPNLLRSPDGVTLLVIGPGRLAVRATDLLRRSGYPTLPPVRSSFVPARSEVQTATGFLRDGAAVVSALGLENPTLTTGNPAFADIIVVLGDDAKTTLGA